MHRNKVSEVMQTIGYAGMGNLLLKRNLVTITVTVHTAYSVIGYSAKSDIVSTLGWYGIPYTNNYWI